MCLNSAVAEKTLCYAGLDLSHTTVAILCREYKAQCGYGAYVRLMTQYPRVTDVFLRLGQKQQQVRGQPMLLHLHASKRQAVYSLSRLHTCAPVHTCLAVATISEQIHALSQLCAHLSDFQAFEHSLLPVLAYTAPQQPQMCRLLQTSPSGWGQEWPST